MNTRVIRAAFTTMRPHQWLKNTFLLAGIIFSGQFLNVAAWTRVTAGFLVYSLLAGCVYIINDLVDIEKDRAHPTKRHRPIPSGELPIGVANLLVGVLVPFCLLAAYLLQPGFFLLALLYFVMNIAYSFRLKNMIILDVMVIAVGFVIRALAGAVIVEVRISPWMFICTLFLAMFLALSKRREELRSLEGRASTRSVLSEYTPELVDQMISIVASVAVMSYALYTISSTGGHFGGHRGLELTIPFVLFGIFRYLYLVVEKGLGGSPERLVLKDRAMFVNMVLWVVTVCLVLMFGPAGVAGE